MGQILAKCPNPECGKEYPVSEELAGQVMRCTQCGNDFKAGESDEDPEVAASNEPKKSPEEADTEQPAESAETEIRSLGRFQILKRIGMGAYGAVYQAYDPKLEREVALKVPRPGALEKTRARERFIREAKAAAQLRHPNIVPVFDAGKIDDQYYIASAYIKGRCLEAVPTEEISMRQAAEIILKLAEAMDYAHGMGIVHRDVKPGNLILDETDEPHIMDFGLASKEDSSQKLTTEGAVLGTPAYMSPEQAEGRSAEAGPASDPQIHRRPQTRPDFYRRWRDADRHRQYEIARAEGAAEVKVQRFGGSEVRRFRSESGTGLAIRPTMRGVQASIFVARIANPL